MPVWFFTAFLEATYSYFFRAFSKQLTFRMTLCKNLHRELFQIQLVPSKKREGVGGLSYLADTSSSQGRAGEGEALP